MGQGVSMLSNIPGKLLVLGVLLGVIVTACSIIAVSNIESMSSSGEETAAPTSTPIPLLELVSGPVGEQLDEYITKSHPLFSGSILVARQGEVLLNKGYNYADWELEVPNSPNTKFRLSSITKPFTATLIMMMHERGLIDVEERICSYLPNCSTTWQPITIHQLLTHTSGIPEYTNLSNSIDNSRDPHDVVGLIDLFKDEPLNFTPGESYRYSNSNYILLGAIIEEVTRERYSDFLEQVILKPLDMVDSGLDSHNQILKGRASGYQILGRALVNAPYLDMTNAYATADMYSTVEDLYRWDQALYSNQLLNQESLEVMYTPYSGADGSGGEYGYGWQLREYQDHRVVGHEGAINGFHTYIGRYLDDQVTIIVLSNIETDEILNIVKGMEEIIFDEK
jgi:CubicO group peptidase (beta-lactamase class C family)